LGCSARTADSMHIIFDDDRHIKVDYVAHIADIKPPCRNIGGHQYPYSSVFKSLNRIDPGVLPFVGMNYPDAFRTILAFKETKNLICYRFGFTENDQPV